MKLNEFLNPKSMITPAIAGGLVMTIANTLWVQFSIPTKWTALSLSIMIVIPILSRFSAGFLEKSIYFLMNVLIVFAMALNTNFSGQMIVESIDGKMASRNSIESIMHLAQNDDTSNGNLYAAKRTFFHHW